MKEEVLYVELPEDAKYQKVIVTGDSRIGVVYSKKDNNQSVISETNEQAKVKIPKPEPLIGGTDVYQKEGSPYWYCKIKNGRDEFMYLYTDDLTEQDLLFDSKTGKPREFSTQKMRLFRSNVLIALLNKPKEGFRWLAVFEASADENGELQFVNEETPLTSMRNGLEWRKLLEEYSPENKSSMVSIHTYFLLALRWLKDGIATLEQLSVDSKEIGNYMYSKDARWYEELTGKREFGGLCGFVGNTCKIVEDPNSESGFSHVGGFCTCFGKSRPYGYIDRILSPYEKHVNLGVLELKK